MRRYLALILTAALALPLAAAETETETEGDALLMVAEADSEAEAEAEAEPEGLRILDAAAVDLDEFLWLARIVAVMADTPNDPAFIQQLRDIEARADELLERDVVVLVDSDRRSDSELRRLLRPRGFMLAIIEKDGAIAQRRPAPRDVREIAAIIDRFPLRRQEILERRPAGR